MIAQQDRRQAQPESAQQDERPLARRGSLLATVRAVAWGLLGIRGRGGHEHDIEKLNPLHLVIVAVACVAAFIGCLLLIVRWAVGSG